MSFTAFFLCQIIPICVQIEKKATILKKKMTFLYKELRNNYKFANWLHVEVTTCVPVTLIKHFSEYGWSVKIDHIFNTNYGELSPAITQ